MVRILGSLLALFVALIIVFLLGSSFLISSDLKRGDLYDKYRNDKSFSTALKAGQPRIFVTKAIAQAHRSYCCMGPMRRFMLGSRGSINWETNFA